MNNKPVAWAREDKVVAFHKQKEVDSQGYKWFPLYTQEQLEEARKLGMQQERALWNLSESTQEIMNTHPVKELTDDEILSLTGFKENPYDIFIEYEKEDLIEFARAILRKAQEK